MYEYVYKKETNKCYGAVYLKEHRA